jgi:archaellum component FlaC
MTNKAKLPVILLVILLLLSLSLAGGVLYLFQKERAKSLSLQEELEDVKAKYTTAQKLLEDSQNSVSLLQSEVKTTKTQIETLTAALETEKRAKLEALAKVEQLRLEVGQQKELATKLERQLTQAQKDAENTQGQLKELEGKKSELEAKLKDLETPSKGVELGKIVVSSESSVPPAKAPSEPPIKAPGQGGPKTEKTQIKGADSGVEGKVLVINKDYNFAVINLGSKDGVAMGDLFYVYHANKYIGDIKIEKIHDAMSAAGFVSADTKNRVNEGDKVVRKSK